MKNRFDRKKTGSFLLIVIALGFIADGSYIYAKAYLAQYLISDAWQQTITDKKSVRPWPWADTWPVARLIVPDKKVNLYVLSGANGASLPFGPGHITGTAFPGEHGTSIIAAHRDTHFNFLKDVTIGEKFQIQTRQGNITQYEIINMSITDSEKQDLQPETQSEVLTLVTCYPFDAVNPRGPLRYVVTAKKT